MSNPQRQHLPYDLAHCHGTTAALCGGCLRKLAPGYPQWQAYFAAPPLQSDGTCASHVAAAFQAPTQAQTQTQP